MVVRVLLWLHSQSITIFIENTPGVCRSPCFMYTKSCKPQPKHWHRVFLYIQKIELQHNSHRRRNIHLFVGTHSLHQHWHQVALCPSCCWRVASIDASKSTFCSWSVITNSNRCRQLVAVLWSIATILFSDLIIA